MARNLKVLAVTTALATYLLAILGSTVRVTHSGMGCPGWPLCYGQLGPIDRFHALMEQSHRYLAATVSVLVVVTALVARRHARGNRALLRASLVSVGVIALQVVLGGITVLTHNAPVTVALHLATGMLLLAVVTVTAVASLVPGGPRLAPAQSRLDWVGWTAVGATFLLLISGTLVVDGGAAASCPSWPLCTGVSAPLPLVTIQLVHRALALVATVAIGAFTMRIARSWRGIAGARTGARIVAGLLVVQIGAGAMVALLKAPSWAQDVHLALAAAIWLGVVALASLGWLAGPAQRSAVLHTTPAG
ncbi:MAG: COX15/CtaA family protein [Acidimicrobiales bacterium]